MSMFLDEIIEKCAEYIGKGKVASYIPELAKADINDFGICIINASGEEEYAGDSEKNFTVQSVVKPILFLMALMDKGEEKVRSLVGVEATGKPFDAFNYSDQALKGEHINPMVNAGAIALCTLVDGKNSEEKFARLIGFMRKLSDNPTLDIDEKVYLSEKATGNKNRALAYMLKAYGMIDGDIEDIVDFYFRACSIKANCKDLARIARIISCAGINPETGESFFENKYARYVNAVLMTCGMYDGSGEFALKVGVPAKSGVGGGIMAVVPGRMGIGIYSPALNAKGNSIAGIKALEILSEKLGLSIF